MPVKRVRVTWVLYSKSESGPPGQYTQMLPVVAMCGHRCGLDMTATTAMPDAVRTGFARSLPASACRQTAHNLPLYFAMRSRGMAAAGV